MGRAPKNGDHGRAYQLAMAKGYRVSKRAFTSLSATDGAPWLVFPHGLNAKQLLPSQCQAFETCRDIITFFQNGNVPTPEIPGNVPQVPTPAPTPAPTPVPSIPENADMTTLKDMVTSAVGNILPGLLHADVDNAVTSALAGNVVAKAHAEACQAIQTMIEKARLQTIEVKVPNLPTIDATNKHTLFPTILRELAIGNNVFISGPAGSGKTTCVEQAGEALQMGVYLITSPSDPFEIFGYRDANGNYQSTPVWRALHDERPALLIFDEIDRSDARALCAAHSILAGNGLAVFPHAQVPIPKTLRIVATANTWGLGADSEYTGSTKLDGATLNRFQSRIFFDYDESLERSIARANGADDGTIDRALSIRKGLRSQGIKLTWTPRDTFALARRIAAGDSWEQAIALSVLATLKPEQRARIGA